MWSSRCFRRAIGDRNVDDKIATYLVAGTTLVIVVDPREKRVELHDRARCVILRGGDVLAHDALPGFTLTIDELFATIAPPQ